MKHPEMHPNVVRTIAETDPAELQRQCTRALGCRAVAWEVAGGADAADGYISEHGLRRIATAAQEFSPQRYHHLLADITPEEAAFAAREMFTAGEGAKDILAVRAYLGRWARRATLLPGAIVGGGAGAGAIEVLEKANETAGTLPGWATMAVVAVTATANAVASRMALGVKAEAQWARRRARTMPASQSASSKAAENEWDDDTPLAAIINLFPEREQ